MESGAAGKWMEGLAAVRGWGGRGGGRLNERKKGGQGRGSRRSRGGKKVEIPRAGPRPSVSPPPLAPHCTVAATFADARRPWA
jgi:hypothetical protein